jgi:HSP20 family protein
MTNMIVRRRAQVNPWEEMDRVWNSLIREAQEAPRKPVVRIENQEDKVIVNAELPGFGAEDIDIQVKENLLTIQAFRLKEVKEGEETEEEKTVVFEKSFVIPEDLEREGFDAEMKNGLLVLNLPRKAKPAPLAVKVKG